MVGISLGICMTGWLDGNGFMSHLKDLSDDDGIDGGVTQQKPRFVTKGVYKASYNYGHNMGILQGNLP